MTRRGTGAAMRLRALPVAVAVACVGAPGGDSHPAHPDSPAGDSGAPAGSDTALEHVGGTGEAEPDASALFTLDVVHTVTLTVGDDGLGALAADPSAYVAASAEIDGQSIGTLGVRLKGCSSFRTLDGKASFKLDFGKFGGQPYDGLGGIALDNMVNDPTQIHEVLGYKTFLAEGLPAGRASFAWVVLDGADYGLYALIETPDADWAARTLGGEGGRVYEGGYLDCTTGDKHADFTTAEVGDFDLEVGEDVGLADLEAIATPTDVPADDWDAEVEAADLDLDAFARFALTEAWVGQFDGYAWALHANNFRVLVDAAGTGAVRFAPSSLDHTFLDSGHALVPNAAVAGACLGNAGCLALLKTDVDEVTQTADDLDLETAAASSEALVAAYIEADPRKELDLDELAAAQAQLSEWLAERSSFLVPAVKGMGGS